MRMRTYVRRILGATLESDERVTRQRDSFVHDSSFWQFRNFVTYIASTPIFHNDDDDDDNESFAFIEIEEENRFIPKNDYYTSRETKLFLEL